MFPLILDAGVQCICSWIDSRVAGYVVWCLVFDKWTHRFRVCKGILLEYLTAASLSKNILNGHLIVNISYPNCL